MESHVDDLKLAGAPAAVVGEAGTLVEHQLVMALPFSESFSETPAQVVEQVAPVVVGQGTDKRRKRRRQTKSLAPKLLPAKKMMKEEEEEVCFICFDGGSLVLCDRKGCPKAYHPACIKRDEAFFKAKWDCGWHICSVCEKAAHYMCYTCTFALCKRCSKNADYVCVRENKGFCTMCMKTIMMIENKDAGSKELIQVDFDDKTSWEYLFKMYWNLLKGKLSLSVDELTQAKNPRVGVIGTDFKQQTPGKDKSTGGGVAVPILPKSSEHSEQNPCRGEIGTDIKQQIPEKDNSTEGVAVPILPKSSEHSEQNPLQDQHQLPDQSSFSAEKPSSDKRKISDVCTDWGSKELLEFVAHMKNGDTSVLSQSDVQALLMEYIKKNNLGDPRLKSQIICDLRLKLLFGKPRVGHIEMLKLLEYHYLLKEDTPKNAFIDGCTSHVGDDSVSNPSKRQKTRKKGEERAPQVNVNEYAAIDAHNINLIFLRRSAIENLIDEVEKFHEKVVGSVVRIRVSCNDQGQDFYRLVRVVGTSKGAEPYKLGYKTTDVMIEVLNLDKKETLSIDAVSNQVFTEDECRHLHQNIRCGIVKPLTVGDIQMKAVALQALRFNDWLIAEILRLSHLRDKANENGRKKEHRECVEKLKLLRTPEVRHQKLTEIPEVHIDPKMNPNHQSEDDTSKTDKQKGEVSKLGITGDHTLQPRKCVKENEATSAQAVQQKRDDGDGSNSSPNHRLRPRKSVKVKENKTTSAQRVQPKRGRGGSNSFPKQENHVSPCGSSSVVGNQSVLRLESETATVAPVSTVRAQRKRGRGGSSSFPKQENDVSPGGSSSVVGNQSVPRPDSETATVAPVSSIQVQQKRDGGGSNGFLKQENHVSPGGGGSTSVIGNQSVLRPDSETATVSPVSTIRVQPKRHGDKSKSIPKQENHVSPGGSSSVLGNQSVRRPDSETATVAPVSTIRVQPKRDVGRSNSIPKQENHVSPGVFSNVLGNQSVPRPDSETASVAPVSTIRVQQKRGSSRSKSFPKQENQVSPGCSSSVVGNQSVLRPDPVTAKVAPVSKIRAQQKKGGGGSKSSPKQENHVSPPGSSGVVGNQSVEMPDLKTATVAPVSRILVQQKRDGGDSNSSLKQENHVSPGGSSVVIGNQSVLKPDSETATVAPVSGIQVQQKRAGGGSNSSPQQDNHVSPGGGSSSVAGNQSVGKPDSETATVAPVSGTQVQQKRDGGGSNSSPQQDNHVSPGGGSSSIIGNQSVLRPDSEAATVAPVSGTSLPTSDTQMDKLWHYRDPNGKIQGPFSMVQLQKWSTTGYFPSDMRIWTDNEQDHSVLLTDALAGDICSDTRSNAAREGLDSHTSDCSAHALVKEKQPEVVQCSDLLKNVPASSERPVVRNNNLETYADPLNQVTKHGVEELNDAGVSEHPDEAALHDSSGMESDVAGVNEHPNEAPMHHSPSIESKNAGGVNVHPIEAPLQYSPSIESKVAGINEHPDEAPLHCSPDIECKDAGVNEHPNEAPLHRSPDIECEDAGVNENPNEASLQHSPSIESEDASVNEHPNEAPMHRSPSIESENAGVNEHPNEAPLLHSPGIESKEMSSMNQNYVSSGQIRPPVLLDLDLNNKDCNPASSLSNPNESPENKVDLDLVNLPSPTPKTGNRNSESQLNEQDSMSIDIQAAELLRSLSGYVPVNGMRVSDVQTPANNEMDEDLPIPTPKPSDSDDGDLRNPEQKPSDENQFGQSDENRLGESDDGPCKILMKDLGWSNASSQVVGGGAQMQETTAGVWISSPARDEPSCKEWDFGLVPMSSLQHSDAVGGGDQAATTTPNGNRHLLLDLSSWPAGINEPIEFNTLAEESVSDLLAEVDAMESKSGLPSPSSAMRCGDDLIDRNDCFSSIEELSPTPDAGKSDAVSSNPGICFPSQPTEFHDHDPVVASQVRAFDPLKRLTAHSTTSSGAETKSVGYPINFWEPGPDIHPPAPGTTLNQQPMINAPINHVWGAVQGNMNMGWAGPPQLPPPPQAFANMGWRPSIGTTAPWVDSNLSLGAYNGNGGWDNNPHRFTGSRDYAVQSGDMGFGRGGRPTWNRQQHGGGGGGGGGGGHSRPSPKGQRVCKFYESGHCKKGSACGYLHP